MDVSPPAKAGEEEAGPPEWVEGLGIEIEGKPKPQYPPSGDPLGPRPINRIGERGQEGDDCIARQEVATTPGPRL